MIREQSAVEGTAVERALAHMDEADGMPIPAIVTDLVRWMGLGLTAMAGGVQETRFVRPWIQGKPPRRPASLRAAWRAAYIINTLCGSEAAKAWFIGQARDFDFEAPITMLESNTAEARTAVVRSAVRFATR
jgi:hypothetical protein